MATDVRATLRKALGSLQNEKARIEHQIAAIETVLGATNGPQRGRQRAAGIARAAAPSMNGRRRRRMSATERKAVSQRMKAYWAARRKGASTKSKGRTRKPARKA
jgi:hypothetical protein